MKKTLATIILALGIISTGLFANAASTNCSGGCPSASSWPSKQCTPSCAQQYNWPQKCAADCNPCQTRCNPCQPQCNTCKPDCYDCKTDPCDAIYKCWQCEKERYYTKLCLTDIQREKARCLDEKFREKTKCLRDSMSCDRQKICALLKADCLDKTAIENTEKQLKDKWDKLEKELKQHDEEFKCMLTSNQVKKHNELKSEYKYKIKKFWKYHCKHECVQ